MIRKSFRFRFYPDKEQGAKLAIQFGHARFVYNWTLETCQKVYQVYGQKPSYFALKRAITTLKHKSEYTWLQEANSQVLQAKVEDLDRAFTNFFEKRARYPHFKSKKDVQSIRYPQCFKFKSDRIYLPKVGWVKAVFHRPLEGNPKNVTVLRTKSGEYYASVQCEIEQDLPAPNGKPTIGIDLGLTTFATLSTGEKIEHPQYLRKAERKLKRLHRQLSRKQKGSRNREKARIKLARACEHVSRRRADFLHKLSHRLVTEYGLVKLETLNVNGMLKNHSLAKSIADSGWSMFVRFSQYKAPWYGSAIEQIPPFYPSSRLCHACGAINDGLALGDRTWICACGTVHDRDENASIVIRDAPTAGAAESKRLGRGHKTLLSGSQALPSLNQEAQTFKFG